MRRDSLFLLLILLLPFSLNGQNTKVINLSYNTTDFNLVTENGETYITSPVHQLNFLSDSLAPALPYIGVNVLVGPSVQYGSFSHTSTQQLYASNISMAPNPVDIPTNVAPKIESLNNVVFTDSVYPSESVIYTGTHIMDGYHYLSFLVCPFKYNTVTSQLFLDTSKTLNITLNTMYPAPGDSLTNTSGSVMREIVADIIINPEEMDILYSTPPDTLSTNYKYLIVTKDSLKATFQRLADWKTQKGVKAKVLTTEEIDNNYTGTTQQLRIKKALKDYYNGTHNGLNYALLGGDDTIVPAQYCYVTHIADRIIAENTPSDLFYACFNTMDWDACEKGTYGELLTDVDIDPEIFVTRLSARDNRDAEIMVNRILTYEKNPNLDNWEDKMLMAGAVLDSFAIINNSLISDTQFRGDSVYYQGIAPYWSGERVRFYDTDSDLSEGGNYELNGEHLQDELEKGYSFVYMDSHGEIGSWRLEQINAGTGLTPPTYRYYEHEKADSLQNNGNTIIVTSACNTNGFDIPTCLSSSFMRNPNSGIIAYYGSSRHAWHKKVFRDLGEPNKLNIELFKELFTSNDCCFARAIQKSKTAFSTLSKMPNTVNRWLHFSMNAMCDPEMPVYLSKPKRFFATARTTSPNVVTISSGRPDCRITAMSTPDNGASYYEIKDSVQVARFSNLPYGSSICITKPGYIPYILEYHKTIAIQNRNFARDHIFMAEDAFVGYHVIPEAYPGPVSIDEGKTVFFGNTVTIENDFEVKLGAELEINTSDYLPE